MIYWLLFLLIESLLLFFYSLSKSRKTRNGILSIILIVAVYFSGFRDCLGMDYDGYRELCERELIFNFDSFFISEPFFEVIRSFCYNTPYSAVVYFLVAAAITNASVFIVYSKYKNFAFSSFVYLTYTGLYLFSFNLTRQFISAGLCLVAAYYLVEKKSRLFFAVFVVLSVFFHKSSLIFILVLLVNRQQIRVLPIIVIIAISYFSPISQVINSTGISGIVDVLDYGIYMDYDTFSVSKTSFVNLYTHILLIPLLYYRNKILSLKNSEMYVFALKMYVIFLVCNNISAGGFAIAYRVAVLFSLFIPIILSVLPQIANVKISYIIVVTLLFLMMSVGLQNPMNIPDRMLPFNSIYDSVYMHFR